jgi:acetate kinase
MRILAINCGSSTLKFQLIETDGYTTPGEQRRLARGVVDRIGPETNIEFRGADVETHRETAAVAGHDQATRRVLAWLESAGLLTGLDGVGHRVVHGGDRFVQPALVDDDVLEEIEALTELAPLHNAPSLEAIRAVRAVLGVGVPMVATFDTAFHRTLPQRASRYAIPIELAEKHRIRRYGFHGLAHRYMAERYAVIAGTPVEGVKLVTLQLGNGCSATAIDGGRSVETSMGFTPLEGLIMGTRSGDVDPSLAGYLARREGVDVEEAETWLNTRSGLRGISGRSSDMRELLEAEAGGDERAALAVDMFCHRVRKYVGAYLAVLGGADAIVFGGGIGENAPLVRARICAGMDWCGLKLDKERNDGMIGSEGRISTDDSRVHAHVIPVDEAAIIARDTASVLGESR